MNLPEELEEGMTETVLVTFEDGTTANAFYDYDLEKWFILGGSTKTIVKWSKIMQDNGGNT